MKHSQQITGGPSYSRDMWDQHGLKMISERIEKTKKSMKQLRDFFQDIANMSFRNASTMHKIQSIDIGKSEFGTVKFVADRYSELIETMSKNEEILGSKIRTQCYQKLNDQINRIARVNTKILSDLTSWQKSLEKEQKKLRKSKQSYDEKKRQCLAVIKALKIEKEHLNNIKGNQSMLNKAPQIESNIMSLQQKCKHMQSQSRDQLDIYIKAVSIYRGFRLKYDSSTCTLLDQLEQTEKDRSLMIHRVLKLYLEIQQVMVQQSIRNIDTISKHIANIDPHSDNMIFVEKYRSKQRKPKLPDPKFHPDDEDDGTVVYTNDEDNIEDSAQVKFWCEKWRLVVGKILERDIELVSPKSTSPGASTGTSSVGSSKNNSNSNIKSIYDKPAPNTATGTTSTTDKDQVIDKDKDKDNDNDNDNDMDIGKQQIINVLKDDKYAFIQLTDDEFSQLKSKCLNSLSTTHGRTAFSLIINRQRNTEYGLELRRLQFLGLIDLILSFFDSILSSSPLDIKPAKLVMIMSQSLYVKKHTVQDLLTNIEKDELKSDDKIHDNYKDKKLFIVDRIKHHLIWKNDSFWREAYCDSVQQEILKYPAVKKWHAQQEQEEAERREEQIIFSQLAAWTHNMKEFGYNNNKIIKFLDSRGLKPDKVEILKSTLQLNDIDIDINSTPTKQNNNNNNITSFDVQTNNTISNSNSTSISPKGLP